MSLKNGGPRSRADTYSVEGEVKVARGSINRWLDLPCRSAVELESTYSSRLNFRLNQSHIRAGSISQTSHVALPWDEGVDVGRHRDIQGVGGRRRREGAGVG